MSALQATRTPVALLAVCALAHSVACANSTDSHGSATSASSATTAKVAPAQEVAPAAEAAPARGPAAAKSETAEYVVEIRPEAEPKAGTAGKVEVAVRPKGKWHFNMEFPTKVVVAVSAGMAVDKPTLSLSDATDKSEAKGATWALGVTPKAGSQELTAELKFAVCTDTTCDPKKVSLAWKLDVKE